MVWTLSGFVDEISDDFDRAMRGRRRAWPALCRGPQRLGTNILDLDSDQLGTLSRFWRSTSLPVSSIGSPIGKIFIDDDFEPHLERMRHAADVAHSSTRRTSGSSPSSSPTAATRTAPGRGAAAGWARWPPWPKRPA